MVLGVVGASVLVVVVGATGVVVAAIVVDSVDVEVVITMIITICTVPTKTSVQTRIKNQQIAANLSFPHMSAISYGYNQTYLAECVNKPGELQKIRYKYVFMLSAFLGEN